MEPNFQNAYNSREASYRELDSTLRKRIVQGIFDLIGMVICFAAFIIVYLALDPKIRYFTCDMSDVSFPYRADTVPFWAVGVYGTVAPILAILIVEIYNAKLFPCQYKEDTRGSRFRKFFISLFHGLSLFVFGISVVLLLTEIGKRWIGRLRPHFMDICKPDLTQVDCNSNAKTGFIFKSISTGDNFCTGDASKVKEARLSFPSGHSSYSVYTMLFFIIYLEARLFFIRFRYVKTLFQVGALIAAYVTCVSRISDYHHRGSDVIGGAILGAIVAFFFTMVLGKVLWEYGNEVKYSDFDLKPNDTNNDQTNRNGNQNLQLRNTANYSNTNLNTINTASYYNAYYDS